MPPNETLPAAVVGGCGVAERQRSREVCSQSFTGGRISRISAMESQHRAFRVQGGQTCMGHSANKKSMLHFWQPIS